MWLIVARIIIFISPFKCFLPTYEHTYIMYELESTKLVLPMGLDSILIHTNCDQQPNLTLILSLETPSTKNGFDGKLDKGPTIGFYKPSRHYHYACLSRHTNIFTLMVWGLTFYFNLIFKYL